MKPYFQDDAVQLFQGDCFEVMKGLESVDTIITDPPYGLHFMGKKWDYEIPSVAVFTEMLRVAKCGATLLCFGGTRTWHRIAVNIEDAGWEIRDTLMFLYGSGFPKSLNIEKALLKQCTCGNMVAYETAKQNTEYNLRPLPEAHISQEVTNPATDREVLQPSLQEQGLQIQQFTSAKNVREGQSCLEGRINLQEVKGELQGSGLSTMPEGISADGKGRRIHNAAQIGNGSTLGEITTEDRSNTPHRPQSKKQQYSEPCAFCKQWGTQKAREWEGYGTALKPAFEPIIMAMKPCEGTFAENALKYGVAGLNIDGARVGDFTNNQPSGMTRFNDYRHGKGKYPTNEVVTNTIGRFPANIIHDGSEEVLAGFPQNAGA